MPLDVGGVKAEWGRSCGLRPGFSASLQKTTRRLAGRPRREVRRGERRGPHLAQRASIVPGPMAPRPGHYVHLRAFHSRSSVSPAAAGRRTAVEPDRSNAPYAISEPLQYSAISASSRRENSAARSGVSRALRSSQESGKSGKSSALASTAWRTTSNSAWARLARSSGGGHRPRRWVGLHDPIERRHGLRSHSAPRSIATPRLESPVRVKHARPAGDRIGRPAGAHARLRRPVST